MKTFYITTPIYYVNDVAHLGHAYTTIMADIIARTYRQREIETFFLTGTDEHGQKIINAAKAKNLTPSEFTDSIVLNWKETWKLLNISNDYFIRTTDKNHKKTVQSIITKLYQQGDIYKGTYSGLYCVGCEAFYLEKDLVSNLCPIHKTKLAEVNEESYFFRLSKYAQKIITYLESKNSVLPQSRKTEIINRVKEDLKDISISRTSFDWGVKFPFDNKHVVYVWFDALINYISALDYKEQLPTPKFNKFWPANIHLIGKEILWFHSVIWPGILFAIGLDPPKTIFAHGWWTINGQKMSKTIGNIIHPKEMVEKYGLDAFRYFLLKGCSFGEDGDFSETLLKNTLNNELANELGNFVNRTITLVNKFSESKIPAQPSTLDDTDKELLKSILIKKELFDEVDNFNLNKMHKLIYSAIKASNKYLTQTEPWKMEKTNKERFNQIIYNALEATRLIAILISPIMPNTSDNIFNQLNLQPQNYTAYEYGVLKKGHKINQPKILFKKIK